MNREAPYFDMVPAVVPFSLIDNLHLAEGPKQKNIWSCESLNQWALTFL